MVAWDQFVSERRTCSDVSSIISAGITSSILRIIPCASGLIACSSMAKVKGNTV